MDKCSPIGRGLGAGSNQRACWRGGRGSTGFGGASPTWASGPMSGSTAVCCAELEAEELGASAGLARIDDALRLAAQTESQFPLNSLHRIRGQILLKCDPADLASAEEAFRTAIAIAREHGARSPALVAALSLAKLYQSTGRPAEAHAVLAPALEGFSPTPEMPEIAEAQALLTALAATERSKRRPRIGNG